MSILNRPLKKKIKKNLNHFFVSKKKMSTEDSPNQTLSLYTYFSQTAPAIFEYHVVKYRHSFL